MMLVKLIDNVFSFYFLLLIIRVFLTWFPNIDWYRQPFRFIREICDVYLNIFRRFIPPFGGLDLSPIVALIVLQVIQVIVINVFASIFRF